MLVALNVLPTLVLLASPGWFGLDFSTDVGRGCVLITIAVGPATGALKSDDCVTSFDGTRVKLAAELSRSLDAARAGVRGRFGLLDGRSVDVRAAPRPADPRLALCQAAREQRTVVTVLLGASCDTRTRIALPPHATLTHLRRTLHDWRALPTPRIAGSPRCGEPVVQRAGRDDEELWDGSTVDFCPVRADAGCSEGPTTPDHWEDIARLWLHEVAVPTLERCGSGRRGAGRVAVRVTVEGAISMSLTSSDAATRRCVDEARTAFGATDVTGGVELVVDLEPPRGAGEDDLPAGAIACERPTRAESAAGGPCAGNLDCGAGQVCERAVCVDALGYLRSNASKR